MLTLGDTIEQPFAALAAADCSTYDEMLVAIEREFHAVHRDAVAESLDEAARAVFEACDGEDEARAAALARASWRLLPDEGRDARSWLLSTALAGGRAAPPVRGAVAADIGRRAGVAASLVRSDDRWAVRLGDRATAEIDPAPGGPVRDSPRRTLCAHDLAFTVLTGLADAWREAGEMPRARRASGLRLLLPIDERTQRLVRTELRALD